MADSRNLLNQLASRTVVAPRTEMETEVEPGAIDHYGAFGCLRGVRERAIMLELRRRNGSMTALGYSWLERVDFDPSTGIVLRFTAGLVTIRGRNLNAEIRPQLRLVDGLLRHRIVWIQEADEPTLLRLDRHAIAVERIAIEEE